MHWAFAECVLDADLYQLRRAGRVVKIEPKVFDVLRYLIEHRDRVVSKAELLEGLWPEEAVSDSVLPRCVAAARKALGDDRSNQRIIQTVHGRGYRFIADLGDSLPAEAVPVAEPAEPTAAPVAVDFVGRGAALERLGQSLKAALDGRGQISLLVGEPGIGKTRTAEELIARSKGKADAFVGSCFEGEGAPAYWPYVQLLRKIFASLGDEELAQALQGGAVDLVRLVPEVGQRLPELPASEPLEGEQARFRLFDSVSGLLARCAARRPLVLALDDLHWADPDSLLLTGFLAGTLRDAPVMIIATYRDVDVRREHPLASLLGDLARQQNCERIALSGLALEDVVQLIHTELGQAPEAQLAEAIHEMTGGNPFFVRELGHLLGEGGRIDLDASNQLSLTLPQSVKDAVGRRLDGLSAECNGLLRSAAVIGREFGSHLLLEVGAASHEEQLELLAEALESGILVEPEGTVGRYAFSHALVRQTLYEELRIPQRVLAHRATADALERAHKSAPGEHLAELAHHLLESAVGEDPTRAVDACVRAAEHAIQTHAHAEAVRHYERSLEALALAVPIPEERRCALLLAQAEARWAAGQRDLSRKDFLAAAEIARRLDDVPLLARAAVGLRGYGEMGSAPAPETLALLEEALEAVGDAYPIWRARLLARLASSEPHSSSMANRLRLSAEAHELTRDLTDPLVLYDIFASRYWARLGPDFPHERAAVGEEAREAGVRLGDPRLTMLGYEALLGANLLLGRFDEVGKLVKANAEEAERLRQPIFLFISGVNQGAFLMNRGYFEEAQEAFDLAIEGRRHAVVYSEVLHAGASYWLRNLRRDPQRGPEADALFSLIERRQPAAGVTYLVKAGIANTAADIGDTDRARRHLDEIQAYGISRLEKDEHWFLTLSAIGDCAGRLGDKVICEEVFALLEPYSSLMLAHDLIRAAYGSVDSLLGALEGELGRTERAIDRVQAAMAFETKIGARPGVLSSRIRLVRLLALAGQSDASAAELERAKADAAEIGSSVVLTDDLLLAV